MTSCSAEPTHPVMFCHVFMRLTHPRAWRHYALLLLYIYILFTLCNDPQCNYSTFSTNITRNKLIPAITSSIMLASDKFQLVPAQCLHTKDGWWPFVDTPAPVFQHRIGQQSLEVGPQNLWPIAFLTHNLWPGSHVSDSFCNLISDFVKFWLSTDSTLIKNRATVKRTKAVQIQFD